MSDYKEFYEKHYREEISNKEKIVKTLVDITISKEIQNTGCFQLDLFNVEKNEIGNDLYDIYTKWSKLSRKIDKLGLDSNSFLNFLSKR